MKKLLLTILFTLFLNGGVKAESNCLKMLNGYVPDDKSIKLTHLTNKTLTLYINNIRNSKDINIAEFGFDQSMADLMQKKYNCPKTRFIKAYDSNGIPQPVKIKGKLLKDYNNQTIIVGK
jgi:hypothetical protein